MLRSSAQGSDYGFDLRLFPYYAKKDGRSVRVLESLPPEQLELPSVSACYGVLLAAAGETTKARKFL